jgi:hypothetical protein
VCHELLCNGVECATVPVADGTACDDGDNCTPDTCQSGTCIDDPLCGQTVAEQKVAAKKGTPVNTIAVRCSVEGASGTCTAQGFVSCEVARDLLNDSSLPCQPTPQAVPQLLEVGDVVVVTKIASADFDRFGVARFKLRLNKLGKRLLKKAGSSGLRLPVIVRFVVRDGDTERELLRVVLLSRKARGRAAS